MKIRIEHASNPLNYGTNMMVTNFMYYLDIEMGNKNKYLLDVTSASDLEYYKKQYFQGNIHQQLVDYHFTYANSFSQRITNKIKRDILNKYATNKLIKEVVRDIDRLVILGGDDLSEYYNINLLKKELYRLNSIKNRVPTLLVGQTIGPFKNERIELVKEAFQGISIYSRDAWTKEYLKSLNINNTIEAADLAFLPLPGQDDILTKIDVLLEHNLEVDKYITIVPSGLYKSYCGNKERYIENWVNIIKYLKAQIPDTEIVLLPHVLRPSQIDDRNIIKGIEEVLGENHNIHYIYNEMSPLGARIILGNGKLTITGRMHAAISTLQMRKPAISVSYSVKYNGVIGEGLGLKRLTICGENEEDWNTGKVEKDICSGIDYVLNNYSELITKIDLGVSLSEDRARAMFKDITKQHMTGNNKAF